mgnify:CR=1 FL=1
MPKLDEQIKTLAGYFAADCEPDGKLTLQLEVEHFLTRSDGQPPAFADVQAALRDLQQQTDAPIITDGEYFGYSGPALTATLGPACQLRISLAPLRDVQDIMDLYNRFYLQLGLALAAHGLRAWTAGCHPTCHAEDLPLVPRTRDEAMDAYLREKGACSVQMMRATAATQVSIDYQDETDFVRKMRAASLLTPFFALLSDNAPVYQASRNSSYCIRTRLWQDVDRDRCGVTPHLMDADFGYARYAENVLTKPQITALRLGRVRAAGGKIAPELYAGHVSRQETAQICPISFTMYVSNPALSCAPRTACRRGTSPRMCSWSSRCSAARQRCKMCCATTRARQRWTSRRLSWPSARTATTRWSMAAPSAASWPGC